jgi:hypothetical protein
MASDVLIHGYPMTGPVVRQNIMAGRTGAQLIVTRKKTKKKCSGARYTLQRHTTSDLPPSSFHHLPIMTINY